MPNPYGSTLGARYNLWIEEAIRGETVVEIDRAIESLRNAFRQQHRVTWTSKMTVVQKVKIMWERSSYYKKQKEKKKQLELALYNKKHKPKPYYRAKERW